MNAPFLKKMNKKITDHSSSFPFKQFNPMVDKQAVFFISKERKIDQKFKAFLKVYEGW